MELSSYIWSLPKDKSGNTFPSVINTINKIGAIPFDSKLDRIEFYLCDEYNIMEYYQVDPKFNEGTKSVREFFSKEWKNIQIPELYNGYITIRFIVNCNGELGRFRVSITSFDFQEVEVTDKLKSDLINSIGKMGNWTPGQYEKKIYDSYKFITLKIVNGHLNEVLP